MREYWEHCDPDYNDGGGAESFREFIQRVEDTLFRVLERPHQNMWFFTHEQFMKSCRVLLMGVYEMRRHFEIRRQLSVPNLATYTFHRVRGVVRASNQGVCQSSLSLRLRLRGEMQV